MKPSSLSYVFYSITTLGNISIRFNVFNSYVRNEGLSSIMLRLFTMLTRLTKRTRPQAFKCAEVEALLSLYNDGLTDARETVEIESHLATCASCSQSQVCLASLRKVLFERPVESPPADLAFRISQAISNAGRRPRIARRTWVTRPAYAVAATATLFGAVIATSFHKSSLFRETGNTSSRPNRVERSPLQSLPHSRLVASTAVGHVPIIRQFTIQHKHQQLASSNILRPRVTDSEQRAREFVKQRAFESPIAALPTRVKLVVPYVHIPHVTVARNIVQHADANKAPKISVLQVRHPSLVALLPQHLSGISESQPSLAVPTINTSRTPDVKVIAVAPPATELADNPAGTNQDHANNVLNEIKMSAKRISIGVQYASLYPGFKDTGETVSPSAAIVATGFR